MNYKIGQRFIINGEEFILAQLNPIEMSMINLNTGLRIGDKLEEWAKESSEDTINWIANGKEWELKEK